jgi:hypothetical protein
MRLRASCSRAAFLCRFAGVDAVRCGFQEAWLGRRTSEWTSVVLVVSETGEKLEAWPCQIQLLTCGVLAALNLDFHATASCDSVCRT